MCCHRPSVDAQRPRVRVCCSARSLDLSGEVYLAMQARGFRGDVYLLDDFAMKTVDWLALVGLLAVAAMAFWMGR